MRVLILLICLCLVIGLVKPPTPMCQSYPASTILPITLHETQRWDLEYLFTGYNLKYNASGPSYISLAPKFTRNQKQFEHNFNFTNFKIQNNARFLGLETDNNKTILYIGSNDGSSGITINMTIMVENIGSTRCFDVAQVYTQNTSYAIIDCANFRNNALITNEFYYVDLMTFKVRQGTKMNDVFVRFTELRNRHIWVQHDPLNNMLHLYRIAKSQDVDMQHRNQTYLQIFEVTNGVEPILVQVIDHTIFNQTNLNIVDFKFYQGLIYLLDFNRALYEIRFTRDQRILIRSKFNIKNDVHKFSLNRLGVNDDLTIVFTNGNQVYEYDWIIPNSPILKYKYTLMANSRVEHIFNNQDFIIISAWSTIKGITSDTTYRKIWVFSHMTNSYLDAFNSFQLPQEGLFNMQFNPSNAHLLVLGNYKSVNFVFNLPFILINPTNTSDIGTEIPLNITVTSTEDTLNSTTNCSVVTICVVIHPSNMSVFGRGFEGRPSFVVDSPDQREFYVGPLFFGPYLNYNLTFNTTIKPEYEIQKRIRSTLRWNRTSNETIVFVDMFQFIESNTPDSIYGIVQDNSSQIYVIKCRSHRELSAVNCTTLYQQVHKQGKIKTVSRVDGEDIEHRMALVYEDKPNDVYVYKMTKNEMSFVGQISYNGVFDNNISSMSISRNMLFITTEIGKRVDVYRLEDLGAITPTPIFRINSTVMRYHEVPYFAPMESITSIYHDQVLFLKTKIGVLALQVDEQGFINRLFTIAVNTANYDMEVSNDNILIIQEASVTLYQLQVPLTNNKEPILLQTLTNQTFTLGKYSDLIADEFFYIIQDYNITVIHTDMPSNSILYDKIEANGMVLDIDAVKFKDREYLIVTDISGLSCWELFPQPKIKMKWTDEQPDFEVQLKANNTESTSNTTSAKFAVLNLSESKIITTQKFRNANLNNIINFADPKQNLLNPVKNISFSDEGWFNGSVLHYRAECKDCGGDIQFQNHVYDEGDIIAVPYIYQVESSLDGMYIQQYESVIKTYPNNSIQLQAMLPTNMPGQPCTKIAVPNHHYFSVSLCQAGDYVNMYITSFISEKPFTFGPTKSGVKQVNKAKYQHGVLMIVDAEDDIFSRQGGIYLYALHLDPTDDEQFALLDVIQSQDLKIQGFKGLSYISSADLKYVGNDKYHLILTQAFSGGIFIFTFSLLHNRQDVIYETKTYINIHKLFDQTLLIAQPLRISTVSVVRESTMLNKSTYGILVTVSNWHHIHFNVTIEGEKVTSSKILRLYQRFPFTLVNYVKIKQAPFAFFAVPYVNKTTNRQVVAVYDLKDYQQTNMSKIRASRDIPITPLMGAHYVNNSNPVCFDFNETNRENFTGQSKYDNLLFVDVDSHNITSLKLNRNLTVFYNNTPGNQTIKLIAMNMFTHFSFSMDVNFEPQKPDPKPDPPNPQPEPDVKTVEIIWIVIMVVGFIIIIGLVLICAYQIKKERLEREKSQEERQSLITRDSNPLGINRTTFNSEADPVINRKSEIETQTEPIQNLP